MEAWVGLCNYFTCASYDDGDTLTVGGVAFYRLVSVRARRYGVQHTYQCADS